MEAKSAAKQSLAERWRAHCRQHPDRYLAIRGTAAHRARIERWEEGLIAALFLESIGDCDRALAFRGIIELRGCTARDAAEFLAVEPQVVVRAMSLLELPAPASVVAAPKTKPPSIKPHTKAA